MSEQHVTRMTQRREVQIRIHNREDGVVVVTVTDSVLPDNKVMQYTLEAGHTLDFTHTLTKEISETGNYGVMISKEGL